MNPHELKAQVAWSRILEAANVDPGRRGRTYCSIHRGTNFTSFSYNDEIGCGHCFTCHWGGDKLDFLQAALAIDFKTALGLLAKIAGVQLGDYCRPDKQAQRRLQASRAALTATRNAYQQWCRERWRLLCEFNGTLLKEKANAELVLRQSERYPDLLGRQEVEKQKRQLQNAEAGIESLSWEIDIFLYRKHESLRFQMWKREVEASGDGL